ncbi:MAG: YtxH domain-containing protein [Chitinophagales bacterium]|jgi:gas vesicle protein|nr:YtxH domain-containing protein [Chitinophagales bacterium]
MDTGKIVLGVLAGAAVGATLGILFAPDKGSVTRQKIAQKSNDYVDGLEDKFNSLVDNMSKQFETVKQEAMHYVETGAAKLESVENNIANAGKAKV